MKIIKYVFWNADQSRLRAGWRLLIHFIVILFLVLGYDSLSKSYTPMPFLSIPINLVYLAGGLSVTWLISRFIDRRSFADLGFHVDTKWWLDFGFGLALGIFVITGVFFSLKAIGWLVITGAANTTTGLPLDLAFLLRVIKFVAVSINEELAFRGYQLKNLAEGFSGRKGGARGAIVLAFLVSSGLFGLTHLANGNATIFSTLITVGAGLVLSLPYLLTGELGVPIGFHLTWNLFMGTIYGFAVSGAVQSTHLLSIEVTGPRLWTGGVYGPDTGLMGLVWAFAGCGLIVAWNKWLRKRVELYLPLATYIKEVKHA